MTTTQKAVLLHPMGSMGEAIADECYAGPYRDAFAAAGMHTESWVDMADRLEIERINLTGARYRESVRLSAHGAEPWDYAAGDAAA